MSNQHISRNQLTESELLHGVIIEFRKFNETFTIFCQGPQDYSIEEIFDSFERLILIRISDDDVSKFTLVSSTVSTANGINKKEIQLMFTELVLNHLFIYFAMNASLIPRCKIKEFDVITTCVFELNRSQITNMTNSMSIISQIRQAYFSTTDRDLALRNLLLQMTYINASFTN